MHYAQLQLDYTCIKAWSVIEFILYNKFVTGPSSTQQTFFWKRETHCEQRLSRPNRTITWVTWLAVLQLCLKVDLHLQKGCSFSTHPCYPHRNYIPCLASNKTRPISVSFEEWYIVSCSMTSLMRAMYIHVHVRVEFLKTENKTMVRHWYLNVDYLHATPITMMSEYTHHVNYAYFFNFTWP